MRCLILTAPSPIIIRFCFRYYSCNHIESYWQAFWYGQSLWLVYSCHVSGRNVSKLPFFWERERENQLWLPATRNTVDSKKLYWSNNIDPMMQNAYYGETLCYIIELPNAQVEFWRSTPCAIICIIVMGFLFRANWEHEKHYKMHTKRNNITITLFTTKFVSSRFVILPPWGKGTHPGFRELSSPRSNKE